MNVARILAYRDFYDLPRAFIVGVPKGGLLLFDCSFDEVLDDYATNYRVIALPMPIEALPADWRQLGSQPEQIVAEIDTHELLFDASRRQTVTIPNAELLFAKAEKMLGSDKTWQPPKSFSE